MASADKPPFVATPLPYNVVRVHDDISIVPALAADDRKALRTVFGAMPPSKRLMQHLELAVRYFIADARSVQRVTPKKVGARIGQLQKRCRDLRQTIAALELTDRLFLDGEGGDVPWPKTSQVDTYVGRFLGNVDATLTQLETRSVKGRTIAFAEQGLAMRIDQLLFQESGLMPSHDPNGLLARLLKIALTIGDVHLERRIGKERKAVAALLRHARKARAEWVDQASGQATEVR